jgi:hypothetical protein
MANNYTLGTLKSVKLLWTGKLNVCRTAATVIAYCEVSGLKGRAMTQVVSRRPFTAEAWVRTQVTPCGICGGQSCTGTGFSPSSSVFLCQYIIPLSLSKLILSGECVIC